MRLELDSTSRLRLASLAGAFLLLACGDDDGSAPGDDVHDADSGFGFATEGVGPGGNPSGPGDDADDSAGDGPTSGGNDDDGPWAGSDDGEPMTPVDGTGETCDASDEAWVKRTIPFVQGRRPEGMREVRLLVSMIEQLDALDLDRSGREIVSRGLARGDQYLDRWRTFLYEEMQINLAGDRRNDECYGQGSGQGGDTRVAEYIRDNPASAQSWEGDPFFMPDVVESGLRLDDMSTVYRANLYANLSAPLIAGNVSDGELEQMRRTNYGMSFERTAWGRTTECLACHRTEWSITDSTEAAHDRHWPVPGNHELAVYGPNAAEALAQRHHAVFRTDGFALPYYRYLEVVFNGDDSRPFEPTPTEVRPAFGFDLACGLFAFDAPRPPHRDLQTADYQAYLISGYPDQGLNATLFDFEDQWREGFEMLRTDGLQIGDDGSTDGRESAAYLFAMNFGNLVWTEAMGAGLTVANNFPRNPGQRDIMHELADIFVNGGFSLRAVVSAVTLHPYFSQAAPADCGASTPYYMAAVFDPFSREASDPAARGNGVGDSVHRVGAWPLLDAIAQSMWWNRPSTFGEGQGADPRFYNQQNPPLQLPGNAQVPEYNCGGGTPQYPCTDEPDDARILRDMGAFLSDSEGGFEGVDLVSLLRLETQFGDGTDPGMAGECTGPLGGACAADDWVSQLIDVAVATPEAQMWDVAAAVKDRIITEPTIGSEAERLALEELMGIADLTATVAEVGAGPAEQAARRLAGVLFNTPQFLLVGIAPPDQDPAEDPILTVPGTSTEDLCNYLAPLILENAQDGVALSYTCSADGVQIGG